MEPTPAPRPPKGGRQKSDVVLQQDLASAIYEAAPAVAEDFEANLQRCIQGAAGCGLNIRLAEVIFDAVAEQKLVTENLFVSREDRLTRHKTALPARSRDARGEGSSGGAHICNIGRPPDYFRLRGSGVRLQALSRSDLALSYQPSALSPIVVSRWSFGIGTSNLTND
jgi:hypothetical protein